MTEFTPRDMVDMLAAGREAERSCAAITGAQEAHLEGLAPKEPGTRGVKLPTLNL